jgi:phage tail tape-measure protein
VISISLSAAAAEAHRNDLLVDADTARRVRLARLARQATMDRQAERTVDRTADRRRPPRREVNRGLVAWRGTSAAIGSLLAIANFGRFSRAATVSAPTDGDA